MLGQEAIPRTAAIAFNAANAAFRQQDYATALVQADAALAIAPDFAMSRLMRARCLKALNNLPRAFQAYEAVLVLEPQNISAHLELGNVHSQMGAAQQAETSYLKAVECRPDDPRGHLALALLFTASEQAGAADRAAVHYHCALIASPRDLPMQRTIHSEIAHARLAAGQPAGALDALRQAWMLRLLDQNQSPNSDEDAPLLCDMARAYLRLGLVADARRALEKAARAEGSEILRAIAVICFEANFWEDGIAVLRRGTALHLKDVDAHLALADMLSRCWKLQDARAALETANEVAPLAPATRHLLLGKIASRLGDVETARTHYRTLVDLGVSHARSSLAMTSLFSAELSSADIARLHRDLFSGLGTGARTPGSFQNDFTTDRPLRIGMVTADLHRKHPVNLFMQPLLARWPHEDLPLTMYFTGSNHDAQTRLAKSRVGQWREVSHESLPTQVAADQIDILIDLAGHTSHRAMALFAKRMAPVQVSYLGYPGSTGVPNMDWIIADAIVAPTAQANQFTERVMHLPQTVFCYAPEADHPIPDFSDEALSRPLTFGSFNNVPKLTPDTIALWARVMSVTSESRLILKAPSFQDKTVVARYQDMFSKEGIVADRISFRGPCGLDEMMQEYGDIDIGLDPLHYGGGTTTLQAMWMGVPVLTLKGDKFAARMGASFMQAAGLDQFVSRNSDGFVKNALAVTGDRLALNALKRGLRDRLLRYPAWDAQLFAEDFSGGLRDIWRRSSASN